MCKQFNKQTNKASDITLKEFLYEYKKIKKIVSLNEKNEYLKSDIKITKKHRAIPITVTYKKDIISLGRKERQEEIKKALINTIQLKIHLKKQIVALKEKEIIEPEIIDSNIKLSNLDIFDL